MIMGDKSDIDRFTPLYVQMSGGNRRSKNRESDFPRELQYHELEESREFRQSRQGGYGGNKPYVKSKRPPNMAADRRQQDIEDDPIEKYRPIEYRRKEKKPEPDEEDTFVQEDDPYSKYKP